jgi:N-acetyl-gamma-glutamyl-phosphate reductase
VPLSTSCDATKLGEAYAGVYSGAAFVGVRPHGELPELADVVGTPRSEIGYQVLPGGRRVLVVSALDNLQKGAASQAVQNLNLACGLPDTTGLL